MTAESGTPPEDAASKAYEQGKRDGEAILLRDVERRFIFCHIQTGSMVHPPRYAVEYQLRETTAVEFRQFEDDANFLRWFVLLVMTGVDFDK